MERSQHLIIVGALVKNDAGEILLVHHHKRGWEMPQGHVDAGEGIMDAILREVNEEAGIDVSDVQLAAVWSKVSNPTSVIFNFVAKYHSGELRGSDETPDVKWFDPAEVLEKVSHPVNRDRLEHLLAFDGTISYLSYSTGPYRFL